MSAAAFLPWNVAVIDGIYVVVSVPELGCDSNFCNSPSNVVFYLSFPADVILAMSF